MHTAAIVLGGGKSSRMGMDKLQLPMGRNTSTTVIEHVIGVCDKVADEVWLAQAMSKGPDFGLSRLLRRVHDKTAYAGPLQAVSNVWMEIQGDGREEACVVLVAGDLPGIRDQVLETCRARLLSAPAHVDAVLVTREGRWQPLVGCYRMRCGSAFARLAQNGESRLMQALHQLDLLPVVAEETGWPDWWTRPIHTPQDYQEWLDFYPQWL